ncbi:hypothetical protein [Burkholderia vietnamiensis]|uniref:hypothetical protein n=1 Tax=Burkholderia vietnamiensis TaxID=60552 RepID=UPI00159324EC|nr:hypothetical protein [Burkholderia vietnamiensis]
MTRYETTFQIGYSIRLEKMQAMLMARADRASNFAQMLLGAAVMTNAAPLATGIAVAALAAYSFVCQPGGKATQALAQKQRYEQLLTEAGALDDAALFARYCALQESDSQVIGSLAHPAYVGEMIRLDQPTDVKLTRLEKIFAFLAGDLPRATDTQVRTEGQ